MSASMVYFLCAGASGFCSTVLFREYRKTGVSLLFWSFLCFLLLTVNNVVLIIDMLVLGAETSLLVIRGALTVAAFAVLIWGMIWNTT